METFLIRLTSRQGASLEQVVYFETDREAIRYGRKLAAPGESLEIWRGDELLKLDEEVGTRTYPSTTVQASFQ